MNQFDYLSNRHALLGLKNKEEINDYDYFLYQEYLKQESERSKQEQELKKDKNNTVNYDLIFSMDLSNTTNSVNSSSNMNMMNNNNNMMMMGSVGPYGYNNMMYGGAGSMGGDFNTATSSYLYNSLQEQQVEQQQQQPTIQSLQFNVNPSIGLSVFDSNSGKLEYRRAPSNQINEDFILNHEQLTLQQLNQQYSGNALLLGEQASQALETLNLTTFTVNNWSENMRKWMIHRVLIPTIKEIDAINLQMHKTIQFNCDFKGYDSFNPLDISPEYQHSIPNSIPHTEDTSKFTLKYVLATLVTQVDQQTSQANNNGFNSGFGFSNGFNTQPQQPNQQQKNILEFGNLLRRRLRLERYLSIPNLNLFDSTDKITCRKYVIDRIRSMSKGQFEKPNSRAMLNSEQFLYEQEIYPTDEEIIVNLFCKFMDFTLDSHGHSNQFSNKYYCDQNIEKKENPHNLLRNRSMLAPGVANAMKKKRGLEKQAPVKKGLYLCKSKVSLSHYNVEDDGNLFECQPGRNNVFYALVIFLHLINTKYDGYIDTVALTDLNLSHVIESF